MISFQVKLLQAEATVVDVELLTTLRFNVAMLSHPPALVELNTYTPSDSQLIPFQDKGSEDAQMVISVVLVVEQSPSLLCMAETEAVFPLTGDLTGF